MPLSARAQALFDEVSPPDTRKGTLKQRAKEIRVDHALAEELWSTGDLHSRMLATLIFDKKALDPAAVDRLCADLQAHPEAEATQVMEWLMANQLLKSAAGKRMVSGWEHSAMPLQRRTFWYQQARLRWTGKVQPDSPALLDALEARLEDEEPLVQWAMNFTAGWIGVHEPALRARCVALGERAGLYRDEVVPRNCTPNYLPEFIRIEAEKAGT